MQYFGYLLMGLGIILNMVGVVGAAFSVSASRGKGFAAPVLNIPEVLKAIPDIITAILKAPQWLLMVIFGCAVFWFGFQATRSGWPFA
jgi:hypothetical protein